MLVAEMKRFSGSQIMIIPLAGDVGGPTTQIHFSPSEALGKKLTLMLVQRLLRRISDNTTNSESYVISLVLHALRPNIRELPFPHDSNTETLKMACAMVIEAIADVSA